MPRERLWIEGWDVINEGGDERGEDGEEEGEEGEEGDGDEDEGNLSGLYGVKRRRKGFPRMGDVDAVLVTGSRMLRFLFLFLLGVTFFALWFPVCFCLGGGRGEGGGDVLRLKHGGLSGPWTTIG